MNHNLSLEKSALPTPTMMMLMGSEEASIMASLVASMSLIAPSVMISSTWYLPRKKGDYQEEK